MKTIYHIDSSARQHGSHGRILAKELVAGLQAKVGTDVVYRDISQGLEFLTAAAIEGFYIPDEQRTTEQKNALRLSDQIVREIQAADTLVMSMPIYNFGPPASAKAWADLVARKDLTFRYTEKGPEGLLKDKKAIIIVTSGGVPVGAPVDHLTPWIKTFLGFIGITDVTILAADRIAMDESDALARARTQMREIA